MSPTTNSDRPADDITRPLIAAIESSRRPLITAHVRVDGDALGAELGLAHILRARGITPHMVNDSALPRVYRFLPGAEDIATSASALRNDYDLAILLDAPTWERAGEISEKMPPALARLVIDHHLPTGLPAPLAWTDASFSSAGEMVFQLARRAGWTIPPEAATCLYAALVTDTGRFTFSNTSSRTLRAAADLMDLGADHALITRRLYQSETEPVMKLRADIVGRISRHASGRIALSVITHAMLHRHGVEAIDTQDMADIPRSIEGVAVGVLLRELPEPNQIKVSLRSQNKVNIEPVARKLGGGGHKEAAGCRIAGDIDTATRIILTELTQHLDAIAPEEPETPQT